MENKLKKSLGIMGLSLLLASHASGVSLLVNGSFEDDAPGTGVPTGWTVQGNVDVVRTQVTPTTFTILDNIGAQDGDQVFQLQDTSNPRSSGITSIAFTVAAADDFALSAFYANGGTAGGDNVVFSLNLLDSMDAIVAFATAEDPDIIAAENRGVYQEFERTYDNLAPGDYRVQVLATKPDGQILQGTLDTVTFMSTTVPEPSSAILAGLGAMAFVMRRRK